MALVPYEKLDDNIRQEIDYQVMVRKNRWIQGQFDFCVIHSDDDKEEALELRDELVSKYGLKGVLEFDEAMMMGNLQYLARIEEMVSRSSIVLMYITLNFQKERMCQFHKNDLLTRYIEDETIQVIPVYRKKEHIPMSPSGLRGVTGLKLFTKNNDHLRILSTFNPKVLQEKFNREHKETALLPSRESELRDSVLREICDRRMNKNNDVPGIVNMYQVGTAQNVYFGSVCNVIVQNQTEVEEVVETFRKQTLNEGGDGDHHDDEEK